MADAARVVDEIRGFLLSYDQSLTPTVRELAESYASLAVDANRRLARCQRLLQQGLRSEAIHLAREGVDLLDQVHALEFIDRPAWLDLVKLYDLATPPELDATAIEFLQSAYEEDSPLQDLMRSHRRLALMRAPLTQRIDVLRKLAAKDAANMVWAADIQSFELVRVQQIKDEAAEAKRRQDLVQLSRLLDEVSSSSWATPPPKPTVRFITQAATDLRIHQTRQTLTEMGFAIQGVFAARDVEQTRAIRERWNRLVSRDGQETAVHLTSLVEPAFLWLDEIDRREEAEAHSIRALEALESGIASRVPRTALEELRADCLDSIQPIPEAMEALYRSRLDELDAASRRRRRLVGAAAIVGFLILGVVIAGVSQQRSRVAAAKSIAEAVEHAIEAGDLAGARGLLDKFTATRPELADLPEVAAAGVRLTAAEDIEANRVARFEAVFVKAREAPLAQDEPPILAEVRTAVRTELEKKRVEALTTDRRRRYEEEVSQADLAARPILDAVESKQSLLLQTHADPGAEASVRNLLKDAEDRLAGAARLIERASEEVRARYWTISANLDLIRAELRLRDRWREVEQALTNASRRSATISEDFAAGLSEAIKVQPDQPRSDHFRKSLAEQPYWSAALAWAQVCSRWELDATNTEKLEVAVERARESTALLERHAMLPNREFVETAREYYQAVGTRTGGRRRLITKVTEIFTDYFTQNIFVTTVREPRGDFTYYSRAPYDRKKAVIEVLDGFKENETHLVYVAKLDNILSEKLSPQSVLARDILDHHLKPDQVQERWDSLMQRLIGMVADRIDVDPILRVSQLKALMEVAGQGCPSLKIALEPSLKVITAARIAPDVRWMKVGDKAAEDARKVAKEVLDKLPSRSGLIDRADEFHRTFREELTMFPQPIGWLRAEPRTATSRPNWTCQVGAGNTLPVAGELFLILPGSTRGEWKSIGFITDGVAEINDGREGDLVEGRLLFVRKEKAARAGFNPH